MKKKIMGTFFALLLINCIAIHQVYGASVRSVRNPQHKVSDVFVNRWSPRAMSGEEISHETLMELFEAARWAQSSYNGQPWVFVYAMRSSDAWEPMFDLLVDFNKQWVHNASVLVLVASRNTYQWNNAANVTHSFDTGAACQNLALQGSLKGLVVHGMSGFDYARAKKVLNIPDGYTVEAMFAVGKPGDPKNLPVYIQENEKPSTRKKIEEFVFEGTFREQR